MSDRELSLSLGKYSSFMASIKRNNERHYDLLKEMGYHEYMEEVRILRGKLATMFYHFAEERLFSTFRKEMVSEMFGSDNSFWGSLNNTAFNSGKSLMHLETKEKYDEVLRRYDAWCTTWGYNTEMYRL